jgi:hypothetical protein
MFYVEVKFGEGRWQRTPTCFGTREEADREGQKVTNQTRPESLQS